MKKSTPSKTAKTDKEKPLRNDVRFLGNIFGTVMKEQEGKEIFGIEVKIGAHSVAADYI